MIVRVDPRYFRPTEVETLLGDPSKAKAKLGWTPTTTLPELVREMVEADYTAAGATAWSSWPASRPTTTTSEGGARGAGRPHLRGRPPRPGRLAPSCAACRPPATRNLLLRTHAELDLTDERATRAFFEAERPGVSCSWPRPRSAASSPTTAYPAEFIRDNLAIQTNVIHAAHLAGVKRLLFLGSSCIYPKLAPQPMREDAPAHRPAGADQPALRAGQDRRHRDVLELQPPVRHAATSPRCRPTCTARATTTTRTNSHVIPALLRKFHEAKQRGDTTVTVWGTGTPRREFLYSDDMADACVFLMNLPDERYAALLGSDESVSGRFEPPLVNIGVGDDVTIAELAALGGARRRLSRRHRRSTPAKPDGTPRKLMDVGRLSRVGWKASTGAGRRA